MNSPARRVLSAMISAALFFGGGVCASAQEADPKVDSESQKFRELLVNLEEKGREVQRLREQIRIASGEDREALARLAAATAEEVVADLKSLSADVVKREKSGSDVGSDREVVTGIYSKVSDFYRDVIDRQRELLDRLRKEREEAPPEDLPDLEKRIIGVNNRLDTALEILVDQVEQREAFGIESSSELDYLEGILADRSKLLMGRIELARESVAAGERRLKGDPDNADLASDLEGDRGRLDLYVVRLSATVEMMKELRLETAGAEKLLFDVTGEITTGLLSKEVLAAIVMGWKDNAVDWLTTTGPQLFFKLVLFVLILFIFRILARLARRGVRKAISTSSLQVSQLLERTVLSVTGGLVMIFGLLVALSQLGFEVGPLLAGLGVAGFIVGFALQDTLSNFAAGFMILLYRPYDVGDLVEIAGAAGKVNDMTLVSTTLLTLDHQTLVIPNSKIWGDVIKNVTAQKIRRVDMVFGISYTDDIPQAEAVLEEIVAAHEGVLESPEPMVKLHNLGDSSVDFVVRPWVKTDDYWNVYWDITREVKMRFDSEGISIPFPQRDVHIISEGVNDEG